MAISYDSDPSAESPSPDTFSTRLAQTRRRRQWTREDLAHAAQLTYGTIARLEQGRNKPDGPTLEKLAVALQVSTDYLLGLPRRADDQPDRVTAPLLAIAVERTNQ
jgi:transcriptional regulator with XRE-family HTH domain